MSPAVKAVYAVWGGDGLGGDLLAKALLGEVGGRLADAGVTRAHVNVSDSAVSAAMLRLTAFPAPVDAVLSAWLTTAEPATVDCVNRVLAGLGGRVEGWLVEEETPLPPPDVPCGERQPCLANVAFLRCPDEMPYPRWLEAWKTGHTTAAIENQGTIGHVQNRVVAPATPHAPAIDAVVEELYPVEALTDPHAFYGSGGDGHELWRRATRMLESSAFLGADRNIDVVPTSRYRVL